MSTLTCRLKRLPTATWIAHVAEPVCLARCLLRAQYVEHNPHAFGSLGEFAPATEGGIISCHELQEAQSNYHELVEGVLGHPVGGSAQEKHRRLIDDLQVTWALPQAVEIIRKQHEDPELDLLNTEHCGDELPYNILPVHCSERVIICMVAVQYDPHRKKFPLKCHEYTNPDEIPRGSRILLRQPNLG